MKSYCKIVLISLLTVFVLSGCSLAGTSTPAGKEAPVAPAGQTAGAEKGVVVGKSMPPISLTDLTGKMHKVGETGKVRVINFWATWCPPCQHEMPELDHFAAQTAGTVEFHAINIQEPAADVQAFMKEKKYSMPVLLDEKGEVARLFHISGIPTTLVVDKQGIIQFRKTGPVTEAELRTYTDKLVQQ